MRGGRGKRGKGIAIAYGKKKKKVAVILPYDDYRPEGRRKLGPLQGKAGFEIRPGFGIADDDLLAS